jgi:AcrR family transcriptional regulator
MFAERGSGGSPIREIASQAGVSLAMVHHYFGNKDGLYAACVDSMYEELDAMRAHVTAEIAQSGVGGDAGGPRTTVEAIVERTVRSGFRFAREHQPAMRLLLRSVVEAGELDAERRHRFQMPVLAQASELLAAANGRPAHELRLAVQSVVFLLARYAIGTADDLARIAGTEREHACAAVEDHLVAVARRLFGFD